MRYRVHWIKHDKAHQLLTGETKPGDALKLAFALLAEARPSDIWIETEGGRRVADYGDIVEDGPAFAAWHAADGGGLAQLAA